MKKYLEIFAAALLAMSCNKGDFPGWTYSDDGLSHGMIVLGGKLDNPYTTSNVQKAVRALYPAKASSAVSSTNYYVRFLPANQSEFSALTALGVEMLDHPLDYEIVTEGDYYHDPAVGDNTITWQYAVVPIDFEFPEDIRHEIIDECFIADNADAATKASGIDWEAVEREAYRLTGNESMLEEAVLTKASGSSQYPSGRITIVDDRANGGQPFGLAGVQVSCNVFVKFCKTYTDRDGYYTLPKKYSSKPRYRLVFKNQKGFAIGFNIILVPASTSTLGKGSPAGVNYTVSKHSDGALFRRSVANNAAYDYFSRCSSEDMNIVAPPSDLRIWLFKGLSSSSAVMIHHGAIVENNLLSKYLGAYSSLIKFFAPDITIGTKDSQNYADIYNAVCHELAHASHFSKVGTGYWNKYIMYVAGSFLQTGGTVYGTGTEDNAGYCEVGEMWAYYMDSVMYKERYGGKVPETGSGYWFYPQIFRYLGDRGLSRNEIFAALEPSVTGKDLLREKLISLYPAKKTIIEQVFNRYR